MVCSCNRLFSNLEELVESHSWDPTRAGTLRELGTQGRVCTILGTRQMRKESGASLRSVAAEMCTQRNPPEDTRVHTLSLPHTRFSLLVICHGASGHTPQTLRTQVSKREHLSTFPFSPYQACCPNLQFFPRCSAQARYLETCLTLPCHTPPVHPHTMPSSPLTVISLCLPILLSSCCNHSRMTCLLLCLILL